MARTMHKLTELAIRNLRPPPKDLLLADGGGLFLRVRASGAKTFILRHKQHGKLIVTTLGQWPQVTLKDARAAALHDRARHGPLAAATVTVRDAVDEFIAASRWKNTKPLYTYLGFLADEIGGKRVRELARADVMRVIERYRPRGEVATNRCISIVRQFFGWCEDMGYCAVSPAHHLRRRRHGHREAPRERVLSEAEMKALLALEGRHAPLLKFLALVPCRIAEAQGMVWGEIDGTRWTIPASRTKSGKAHWFELPPAALALLGEGSSVSADTDDRPGEVVPTDTTSTGARPYRPIQPRSGRVFRHQTSPTAVQAWLRRWQKQRDDAWTPHDLRRTARTHATGTLGYRESVAEKWLGHELQGLLKVYDRSEFEEERVRLAHEWAAWVTKPKEL